jgi:C_GCAxxG_C_C family probable redox protein
LQEEFDMGNLESFKAATVLAGGVARRGETCGALLGALMGLGVAGGRERMDDTDQYRKAMQPAQRIADRFQEELQTEFDMTLPHDTTMCRDIQASIYGRSFDLNNPKDYRAFLKAGGHSAQGCPLVCAVAAQVAGEEILDMQDGSES